MKSAVVAIKQQPHYRRDAFEAGLKRLGYSIVGHNPKPRPGDVLLTWNLIGSMEREADRFRRAGGVVLIAENAYFTPQGVPGMYAISKDGHNGAGKFPAAPDSSRWREIGHPVKPWRRTGTHILVAMQRGIGPPGMASPHCWHQHAAAQLQKLTGRPIRIRQHPGLKTHSVRPLSEDLADCWAAVIWNSAMGVQALVAGVPVFFAAPHWICSESALPFQRFSMFAESPLCDDRLRENSLIKMAQGQWSHLEIATGAPLEGVIKC